MLEEHHFQPKNKLMHFFSLILKPAGTAQPSHGCLGRTAA
jgi:hypothetical protein